MNLLISLCLVLFPATLALKVPTGCVTIQNRYFDGYLVHGEPYDEEHRHVVYGAEPEQWHVRKGIGGYYKVTNMVTKEELFESELTWKGHYVFTRPLELGVESGLWDIGHGAKPGYFKLSNADLDDCLALSFTGILNLVVISAYRECDGAEFEWRFNEVECSDKTFDEYEESKFDDQNIDI